MAEKSDDQPGGRWKCTNPECGKELPGNLLDMRVCPECKVGEGREVERCKVCLVELKSPADAAAHRKICNPVTIKRSEVKPHDGNTSSADDPPSRTREPIKSEEGQHIEKLPVCNPNNTGESSERDMRYSPEGHFEPGAASTTPVGDPKLPSPSLSSLQTSSLSQEESSVQETEQSDKRVCHKSALVTGKAEVDNNDECYDAQSTWGDDTTKLSTNPSTVPQLTPKAMFGTTVQTDKPDANAKNTLKNNQKWKKREEQKKRQKEHEDAKREEKQRKEAERKKKEQHRVEERKKREETRKLEIYHREEAKKRKEQETEEKRRLELARREQQKKLLQKQYETQKLKFQRVAKPAMVSTKQVPVQNNSADTIGRDDSEGRNGDTCEQTEGVSQK